MGLFDRLFARKTADPQPRLQVGLGSVPYPPPPPRLPVVVDEVPDDAPLADDAFTRSLLHQFGAARGARLARLSRRLRFAAITGPSPFVFLEGNERGDGGGWRSERWRYTFSGDDLVRFAGLDGLPIFLAETLVDVQQHQDAILALCAQNDQRVLRTAAEMKRLTVPLAGRHTVVDERVAAQWEPPHFDGRALRFVVDSDVDLVRVVVDASSFAVDVHVLGPTAQRDVIGGEFTRPLTADREGSHGR